MYDIPCGFREPTTKSLTELKSFRASVDVWKQHRGVFQVAALVRAIGVTRQGWYVWKRKWVAEGVWPPVALDGASLEPPAEEAQRTAAEIRARSYAPLKAAREDAAAAAAAPDPGLAATKEFLARTRDDVSLSDDIRTKAALGLLRAPTADEVAEAVIPDEEFRLMLRDAVALEFGDAVAGALASTTGGAPEVERLGAPGAVPGGTVSEGPGGEV